LTERADSEVGCPLERTIRLAVAAASGSLAVLAITLLYVVPVYVLYSRSEERMMLADFGARYQRYQRSTGMRVPRIRVSHDSPSPP